MTVVIGWFVRDYRAMRSSLRRLVPARGWLFCVLGAALTATASLAACVGDEAASPPNGTTDPGAEAGGPGTDGSSTTTPDGGTPGVDSGCAAAACVDNGAALGCGATKTTCDYGCAEPTGTTAAHCRAFDPSGAVDPTDLAVAGVKDFAGHDLKFFTDTGRITTSDEGTEIRPPNADPLVEEVSSNGIGFRKVAGKVGIFQFKSFTLQGAASGAFFEVNSAFGSVAFAIVASDEIKIEGLLELGCNYRPIHPYAPAAGAAGSNAPANAQTQENGKGTGGGLAGGKALSGNVIAGGGGGGHAASGGQGGDGVVPNQALVVGGNSGVAYDDLAFDPPLGGSGGGAGNAAGGGGGGALQLVAGKRITIGDGLGLDAGASGVRQGVNAGGCGGQGGFGTASAGGGGSGGSIVHEAPEVIGKPRSGVASNGGGGGGIGGIDGTTGQNGVITTTPATGGPGGNCFGAGGKGGAGSDAFGEKGTAPPSCTVAGQTKYGGGGGGAAGRVRINTSSGDITADPTFVISPTGTPAFQKAKIVTR